MKRALIAVLILSFCIDLFGGCGVRENDGQLQDETTASQSTEAENNKMPDFSVYNENGEKISFYEKLGKPVVLNFWATWCPPCKAEMPHFEKLYGGYKETWEFMMVNLTDGERDTTDSVKEFISDNGYTFPIYYDSDMSAAMAYGVQSIPMTLFIDKDGDLITYHVGAMTEAQLKEYLEKTEK